MYTYMYTRYIHIYVYRAQWNYWFLLPRGVSRWGYIHVCSVGACICLLHIHIPSTSRTRVGLQTSCGTAPGSCTGARITQSKVGREESQKGCLLYPHSAAIQYKGKHLLYKLRGRHGQAPQVLRLFRACSSFAWGLRLQGYVVGLGGEATTHVTGLQLRGRSTNNALQGLALVAGLALRKNTKNKQHTKTKKEGTARWLYPTPS